MASAAQPRSATYEDLVALPPNVVGEILHGELFASPRPTIPHAHAASVLGSDLGGAFGRGRGGPGVGGSSPSPSFTWVRTFWSPTSLAGDASVYPLCRARPRSA
jgi:hypothetical protein